MGGADVRLLRSVKRSSADMPPTSCMRRAALLPSLIRAAHIPLQLNEL